MKKILAILGMAAVATMLHAQGWVQFQGTAAAISTNNTLSIYNAAGATQTILGSGSGKTATQSQSPFGYYFALLYVDASTISSYDVVSVFGGGTLFATNSLLNGGISGNGGSSDIQVNLAAGTSTNVVLVGWSASLGTTWSAVASQLSTTNWTTTGYFGVTSVGVMTPFATQGAGDPTLFTGMFPNGSLTLYQVVPVPEPTTIALAGLGGVALLAFRRRKA